jgi:hypothetical protein
MNNLYAAFAVALGISSTAAFLNNQPFDILLFITTLFATFSALVDNKGIWATILKFILATALIIFYPIPGIMFLLAIALPFITSNPLALSLQGLLLPLFAVTIRGGDLLFTRETISFALTVFGAYVILLNFDQKKIAYSGLGITVLASAFLKAFIFLFPAQLLLLFTFFKAPNNVGRITSLVYLVMASFSGFYLYLLPLIQTINNTIIRWVTG